DQFSSRLVQGFLEFFITGRCRLGVAERMRNFLADRRGNFALMTAIAMVPLMGAAAIAVDYSEMSRERQAVVSALDAANVATALQVVTGASDDALHAYAKSFFEANLDPALLPRTQVALTLPTNQNGGGTMKLCA